MNNLLFGLAAALSLGATAASAGPEFAPAKPGYQFAFPRDHASHPKFKTEWWYYTGHLKTTHGRQYGYELTFFRVGVRRGGPRPPNASRWRFDDLHLAHFAVSDETEQKFRFFERLNRPGLGLAGAETTRYRVHNGSWLVEQIGDKHHLRARGGDVAIDLVLGSKKPPVVHGHDGLSRKGSCDTCASHYYSMTRMQTSGILQLGDDRQPVSGQSWMDHEFGSAQLTRGQVGWDWFSLQLDDGSELMLYHLRRENGQTEPASSGTYVRPDGSWVHLPASAFTITPAARWKSPHTGGDYPMGWRLQVPSQGLDVAVKPSFEDQELVTKDSTQVAYWEGSAHVTGTKAGKPLKGQAYVELVGYAERFKAKI